MINRNAHLSESECPCINDLDPVLDPDLDPDFQNSRKLPLKTDQWLSFWETTLVMSQRRHRSDSTRGDIAGFHRPPTGDKLWQKVTSFPKPSVSWPTPPLPAFLAIFGRNSGKFDFWWVLINLYGQKLVWDMPDGCKTSCESMGTCFATIWL